MKEGMKASLRRICAMFLSVVMVISVVSIPVQAEETTSVPVEVAGTTDINATVKMFNYDEDINAASPMGEHGYVFFTSDYEDTNGDGKKDYHGSVDGKGASESDDDAYSNTLNKPTMSSVLNSAGYPQATGSYSSTDSNGDSIQVTYDESFQYLFGETLEDGSSNKYYKGTMNNGGGLFRYGDPNDGIDDGALEGYYYYDSAINSAVYNGTDFTLYDTVVRPRYQAESTNQVSSSNFLPFNPLVDAQGNSLVTMDATKKVDTATKTAALKNDVDLWFGMTVEFEFYMPKDGKMGTEDMIFDFYGDDDVLVYIDDKLVLNINGTHAAESGTINFSSGDVAVDRNGTDNDVSTTLGEIFKDTDAKLNGNKFADYTKHTLKFFYLERGGNISYCRLKFNMPTLPPNSLSVGKELTVTGDGTETEADFIQNSLSYQFRVWQADAEGKATDQLFIKPGMTYEILEGTTKVGTGTVDKDGLFSLKAGQVAQFTDMLTKGEGKINYVVEEILPTELEGQYGGVEYTVDDNVNGTTKPEGGQETDFSSFQTGSLSAEDSQIVTFKNKVNVENLGTLKITKEKTEGANFEENKTFAIQVKLGNELLPVGTEYKVGSETRTVQTAGIINLKIDETAVFEKAILSGTEYSITEIIGDDDTYKATYTGTVSPEQTEEEYQIKTTGTGVSGKFPLGGTVEVTVINENFDFSGQIPITKTTKGNTEKDTFSFVVEEVEGKDGTWATVKEVSAVNITVDGDTPAAANATIAYDNTIANETFYYKVYEKAGRDSYIYDDTFYIVKIDVGINEAVISSISKNGETEVDAVTFENQKLTSVIVDKDVLGVNTDGTFSFTASINGNDSIDFELKDNDQYEIGEIPVGAEVTVTENVNGYTAFCQIGNGTVVENNAVTFNAAETTTYIHFTNAKYTVDDTVVIDYGLPVDVNVLKNDAFAGSVTVGLEKTEGTYGTASVLDSNEIRYTPGSMTMDDADVFTYDVDYTVKTVASNFEGKLTVIPATTIYYEDSFVNYRVVNESNNEKQWRKVGSENTDATQAEDRPGESDLDEIDADNLYGNDEAYENCVEYSNGSAMMVNVNSEVYAEAEFTFTGTGFDIVSLTSNKTGTILVDVYAGDTVAEEKLHESYMVDTYYGYCYGDNDGDGIKEWYVDESSSDNALYQIPVMKVDGLDHGTYTVVITAAYNKFFDHSQYENKSYDFYLDAIRIYDPADDGNNNDVIKDAYVADGEYLPEYYELRNLLITANNFKATAEDDTVPGIVFIDGISGNASIEDYKNYGPNNEVYLAANQAVAFNMNYIGDIAKIQIAVKSVGGSADIKVYAADDNDLVALDKTVSTATDLYYDITSLNGHTVVIINDGTEGIISVTNIKTTYNPASIDETPTPFTITRSSANIALASMAAAETPEEPEVPAEPETPEEPEAPAESTFEPETFKVKVNKTKAEVGDTIQVTVTTSSDVDYIVINGEAVTEYSRNWFSGNRTWKMNLTADAEGEMSIITVAYNTDGTASNSIENTVAVSASDDNTGSSSVESWISNLFGNLFGWLK